MEIVVQNPIIELCQNSSCRSLPGQKKSHREQNHVEADFYMATNYPEKPADIVVANILSGALMVLAPALAHACKSNGRIALSGILREQAEQVSSMYAEWFDMDAPVFMDSWVLLSGTRK